MGNAVAAYFADAHRAAGVLGRMRLAALTGITSAEAQSIEETPQILERFAHAMQALRRELQIPDKRTEDSVSAPRPLPDGRASALLRRHVQTYLDLMGQREHLLGHQAETLRRVDEAAAETLEVARVSVWALDGEKSQLSCLDLYERTTRAHSSGIVLWASAYPNYFAALAHERTIAAHDAHRDPRTSCFSDKYLRPIGINSMLDVPIWVRGTMFGVLCMEHIGPARMWSSDEENFAYLMSNFVSLSLEMASR